MSDDLPEFTLFYYYDATPEELVEFLNKYSFREIQYHVYMLENLQAFNHFFINYNKVDPNKVNNIDKLRFLHSYKVKLIKHELLTYKY